MSDNNERSHFHNKQFQNVISPDPTHSLQAAAQGEFSSFQVPAIRGKRPLEVREHSSELPLAQIFKLDSTIDTSRRMRKSIEELPMVEKGSLSTATASSAENTARTASLSAGNTWTASANQSAAARSRFAEMPKAGPAAPAVATATARATGPAEAAISAAKPELPPVKSGMGDLSYKTTFTDHTHSGRDIFSEYVDSLPPLEKEATVAARTAQFSEAATSKSRVQQRLLEISGTIAESKQSESVQKQPRTSETEVEVSRQAEKVSKYFAAMTTNMSVPKYNGLCGTALCYVMNPTTGNMVQIRALLDSGANLTMLNRETAKALGLTGKKLTVNLNVAGGGSVLCEETEVVFNLVKKDKSHITQPIVGITTESVGNPFSAVDFKPRKHKHLKDIELADKFPTTRERPFQLLLSEPYFSMLEKPERKIPQDPSLPMAVNTELGWVLRGAAGIQEQVRQASAYGVLAKDHESFDLDTMYKSIGFDFAKFWTGENIGIQVNESMSSELTALEIQAEEFQKQTAHYDAEKRQWSVHLPWINQDPEARIITDNTSRAVAMWHKVLRSVKEEHMSLVIDAYEELLKHGFAEKVPDEEVFPDHPTYVMTSRPVFRFDKTTTKCRIVINASLPDQADPSKSLNKLLMPGPNKLPQIMMLVLRTMVKEHLVLVDVRKMFLAIQLEKPSDKDMLRFVWATPGSDRPNLLRYKVLAFGVVSSPYQAIWCLHETAKMFLAKYPVSAQIILDMTYMDDINITADSIVEARKLTMEVLEILQHGGFYGHKISASNLEIVDKLDVERLDQSRVVSVLGLKLNHDTCEFMFDLDQKFDQFDAKAEKITRTDVVSLASKIFDTQGFVSPYVMQYKKILPMLWQNKTTWTENLKTKTVIGENGQKVADEVATEAVNRFCEWIKDVPRLKELNFPRYIKGGAGLCGHLRGCLQNGNWSGSLRRLEECFWRAPLSDHLLEEYTHAKKPQGEGNGRRCSHHCQSRAYSYAQLCHNERLFAEIPEPFPVTEKHSYFHRLSAEPSEDPERKRQM